MENNNKIIFKKFCGAGMPQLTALIKAKPIEYVKENRSAVCLASAAPERLCAGTGHRTTIHCRRGWKRRFQDNSGGCQCRARSFTDARHNTCEKRYIP